MKKPKLSLRSFNRYLKTLKHYLEKSFKVILEVCAVAIALFAFLTTYQQGKIQREQNQISVEPRLSSYFSNDGDRDQWGLYLINNGLGTAYIDELQVFVNGTPVKASSFGLFFEAAKELGLNVMCFKFAKAPKNHSIAVNTGYPWIESHKDSPKSCAGSRLALKRALDNDQLNYKLEFRSIYDIEFKYELSTNAQISI